MQVVWDPNGRDICDLVGDSWIKSKFTEHTEHALGARAYVSGLQDRYVENWCLSLFDVGN